MGKYMSEISESANQGIFSKEILTLSIGCMAWMKGYQSSNF